MARVQGVDLPDDKRVEIGLTAIYGVGRQSSDKILAKLGISPDTRVKDLTESELSDIRNELNSYLAGGDLRRDVAMNIKRLKEINCYRESGHKKDLPVGGQHTENNARTRKSPRKQAWRGRN